VRAFWKGVGGRIAVLASRLTGSSDIFEHRGRRPSASINFITAHDGFTLEDLVSYNVKHNTANLEDNRDGSDENLSWNCGVEGPTDDPAILALRARQKRNMMATLLLSQGVPMLAAGDELGRSQGGNNNAYCQDNETSWLDWRLKSEDDRQFLEFVRTLCRLRHRHPAFGRPRFFHGEYVGGAGVKDITWLAPEGREMAEDDWHQPYGRCLGFHLGGDTGDYFSPAGQSEGDDRFVVLLNAHDHDVPFHLPPASFGKRWRVVLDTARPGPGGGDRILRAEQTYPLEAWSLVLLAWDQNGAPA
jgi:glycogen operon protein